MSTLAKKSRVLLTLLLVLVMLIPLFQGIRVFASYDIVHFTGFESGKDGWTSYYGGSVAISNEEASASEHSLKMTGRTKSWHSPGKNIYSIIRENGAGEYRITISVLISSVNPGNDYVGMLIRTNRTYSFSTNHNGNIYCRLGGKYKGITSGEWFTVEGNVTVSDDDISPISGEFDLMLDLIEPVDGQAVYIDNVVIRKKTEPDPLVIDKTHMYLYVGGTQKINANKEYGIAFYSENKNIAKVDSSGVVTGISPGVTTVQVMTGSEKRYCTVEVDLAPDIKAGTYLMRNMKNGDFLRLESSSAENGRLGESNGNDSAQQWQIVYTGGGYFRITSMLNGKSLAVKEEAENRDNVNLVLEPYCSSDRQKWLFTLMEDGYFKIKPKSSERAASDWCIAANGTKVQQRKYVISDKSIAEWWLTPLNGYKAQVFNFYDNGYPVRYNENASVSAAKIKGYNEAVAKRLFELVGLEVIVDDVKYFRSSADECKWTTTSENIDELCDTHLGTSIEHTTRDNMMKTFNPDISSAKYQKTKALWSGHKITSTAPSGKTDYNRSCSWINGIYIISIMESNSRQRDSKCILMQELAHQYGAKDHYHEIGKDGTCEHAEICSECNQNKENARPKACIMNNSYQDIDSVNILCYKCQQDIIEYLNSTHYDDASK